MNKSEMRVIVEVFLETTNQQLKTISEESGVTLSILKKINTGRQSIDSTNFSTIEKLYFYALEILKMKSFVSLNLQATTKYATELEEINFYEFEAITINLKAENNQTVELQFNEFQLDMFSDDKVKHIVNVENAMNDVKYSVDYLNSLNLNDCKKAEIVFDDAGSEQIKIELDIDTLYVTAEKIEDENEEFRKMMHQIADEDDEIFKALVDK